MTPQEEAKLKGILVFHRGAWWRFPTWWVVSLCESLRKQKQGEVPLSVVKMGFKVTQLSGGYLPF